MEIRKKTKRLTESDSQFITELIVANHNVIAHVVRKVVGDNYFYLYEDCISETFLAACENVNILREHENPSGWIIKTARLMALHMIREHRNDVRHYPLNEAANTVASEDIFEEVLYKMWEEDGVREKLISLLAPRERQIYEMSYVKKKTTREIAEELNISLSTVWNTRSAIREKIINEIDEKYL